MDYLQLQSKIESTKNYLNLSMNLSEIGQKIAGFIKIVSIVLITGAIGLELGKIFGLLNTNEIPNNFTPIFGIARFALIAHLFEGIVAAIYARPKNKLPFQYGIYTFFVGTVGLVELFRQENS
ncbi:hypothetical protein A6S26_14975 [Nostoc sp. ATCC 43529]|nr:hypothetical protein A6S26_14975 [Nostoc sp. ATCC 43529]